jgi:hypothetical protein
MKKETEGILAILAAMLVLFSAMIDPPVSLVLAVAALGALGAYLLFSPPR